MNGRAVAGKASYITITVNCSTAVILILILFLQFFFFSFFLQRVYFVSNVIPILNIDLYSQALSSKSYRV